MSASFVVRRHVAVARFWHRLLKLLRRMFGVKKTVYVGERVDEYREVWQTAAEEEGFEFVPLSHSIWEVKRGADRIARIRNYVISLDDPVTLAIAGDKRLTYELFAAVGLSIPQYVSATQGSLERIVEFVEQHPGPYVVKPARNTASGHGVTTNLRTLGQSLSAAALAFTYCDEILIEEHVIGESYRLLFLDGEMLCASRRTGLRVTGDGERTLEALITAAIRADGADPRDWLGDRDLSLTLERQAYRLDSVLPPGETVLVRSGGLNLEGNTEVRTVYTEDVGPLLCDELIDDGRKASRALGSEFCGVDIITLDPRAPLSTSGGVISEINTTPGLHHHTSLGAKADGRGVANRVLRYAAEKLARAV